VNQDEKTEFRIASGRSSGQNSRIPMVGEPTKTPEEAGLLIRPSTGLVSLPDGGSPVMAEIISRSLVHIQTSKALGILHRIGEHELYGPDYRLICAWAEELRADPGDMLKKLVSPTAVFRKNGELRCWARPQLEIREGQITYLDFPPSDNFPETLHFHPINDLRIEALRWYGPEILHPRMFSYLTELTCGDKRSKLEYGYDYEDFLSRCAYRLSELDLSGVPHLTNLCCCQNYLTELDLSGVPLLTTLHCSSNELTELDLSRVPLLVEFDCGDNQLSEIDLSFAPRLKVLHCDENQLRIRAKITWTFGDFLSIINLV